MPDLMLYLVAIGVIIVGFAVKILTRASEVELRPADVNIGGPVAIASIVMWVNYIAKNIDTVRAQGVAWVFVAAILSLGAVCAASLVVIRKVDELDVRIKDILRKERDLAVLEKKENLNEISPAASEKINKLQNRQWWASMVSIFFGLLCVAMNAMLKW